MQKKPSIFSWSPFLAFIRHLYMPTPEQHFLNAFISFSSLTHWCTPKLNFNCNSEVKIYLVTLLSCSRYGLQNSVIAKVCSSSPGKQLFLVTKTLGKGEGQNSSGSNLMNVYTQPTCLLVFCICNLRKTLLSISLRLDEGYCACAFFWTLKAQFLCFLCRAFSLTSNL